MSITVPERHGPGAAGRLRRAGRFRRAGRDAHERLVVAAAVLATLAVIAGPGVLAAFGLLEGRAPVIEEPRLSENAQRVLEVLPGAYELAGAVIVPAIADPDVAWNEPVARGSMDGMIIDLGVRGLVEFGTQKTRATTPLWRSRVRSADRVFSDVGPLFFACVPSRSGDRCAGSVLMQPDGRWHALGEGAGPPGRGSVTRLTVLGSAGEAGLWLGWMPPDAATAWATVVGQLSIREVPVRTEETMAAGGARVWWLRSSEPVSAVSFRDARGNDLARVSTGTDPGAG